MATMLADRIEDGSEGYLLGGGQHGADPTDEFGWDRDRDEWSQFSKGWDWEWIWDLGDGARD